MEYLALHPNFFAGTGSVQARLINTGLAAYFFYNLSENYSLTLISTIAPGGKGPAANLHFQWKQQAEKVFRAAL